MQAAVEKGFILVRNRISLDRKSVKILFCLYGKITEGHFRPSVKYYFPRTSRSKAIVGDKFEIGYIFIQSDHSGWIFEKIVF